MTAALIGTAMDRNTIISSSTDSTITAPMKYGRREAIWSEMSMNVAVGPPTYTAASGTPSIAGGMTSLRSRWTRSWWLRPAATSVGSTRSTAAVPSALACAGATDGDVGVGRDRALERVERRDRRAATRPTRSSGPLKPGPNPSASRS